MSGISVNVNGTYKDAVDSFVNVNGDWTKFSNGIRFAVISGGTTVEYTEGGITWRLHEIQSTGSLTIVKAGYVETLLVMGGGGGGNYANTSYPGGGGGGGGSYLRVFPYLEAQTITASIGAGGAGTQSGYYASNGGPTTVTIQGLGDDPGKPIICGGGGGGGGQQRGGKAGGSGSNGGGSGARGGQGAAPGSGNSRGSDSIAHFYLDRSASPYGMGGAGGDQNTGNGGRAHVNEYGRSGVVLFRVPVIEQ